MWCGCVPLPNEMVLASRPNDTHDGPSGCRSEVQPSELMATREKFVDPRGSVQRRQGERSEAEISRLSGVVQLDSCQILQPCTAVPQEVSRGLTGCVRRS
ncbi:hypothetical protein L1887_48256 [Cichorium endivia]|nr:hypothetical protein L1887_48256 [Cichorium endivia]